MTERFGMFTARMECPRCGHPVPLSGPTQTTSCPTCLNEVDVPAGVWLELLDSQFDTLHERLRPGTTQAGTVEVRGLRVRFEVAKNRPVCEKCSAPFSVDALKGRTQDFSCTHCGDRASTEPIPGWIRKMVPTAVQLYSIDPSEEKDGTLDAPAKGAQPILLGCPSCGSSLTITGASERLLPCNYCHKEVYLPDEVWRRLHPVKTAQPFYVRFDGVSSSARAQQAQNLADKRRRDSRENAREKERQRDSAARTRQSTLDARHEAYTIKKQEEERRNIAKQVRRAWIVDAIAVVPLFGSVCFAAVPALEILGPPEDYVIAGVTAAITILIAIIFANIPLKNASKTDSSWISFATMFWIPFSVIPIVPLVRFVILWRGKFASANISNGSGNRIYPEVRLRFGEGRPAAVVFLLIFLAECALVALSTLVDPALMWELRRFVGI